MCGQVENRCLNALFHNVGNVRSVVSLLDCVPDGPALKEQTCAVINMPTFISYKL